MGLFDALLPGMLNTGPDFSTRLTAASQNMAAQPKLLPRLFGGAMGFANPQENPANLTIKALQEKGVSPQIAQAASANPDLMKALVAQHFGAKQVQVLGDGYIYRDGQVVKAYDKSQANGPTEYGVSPIYGQDESGNTVAGVVGKDGTFKKLDLGGVKLLAGVDKIDMGTQYQLRDKKTGLVVGYEPKNVEQAANQRARGAEIGEATAKNEMAAAGDMQAGQNALDILDKIRTNPYLDRGTGFTSLANNIPGTGGYDFQNLVEQAKSGAFLTAIQQMRGLGSLSNAEGSTATAAVNRMNTATSKQAFLDALNDYEKVVRQGVERGRSRLPNAQQAAPTAPANVSVDALLKKYGGQ